MSGFKSENEGGATYPECRCVDPTKPVCYYCEDTLDGDSEDEDSKGKDNEKQKKQVLG